MIGVSPETSKFLNYSVFGWSVVTISFHMYKNDTYKVLFGEYEPEWFEQDTGL